MPESIKISNFLVIKEADIEVKKINLIIGQQANGKSVIAKLLHYFKTISKEFLKGIRSNISKRELDKLLVDKFAERFPIYSWEGTSFTINYCLDELNISLIGTKNSRGKTSIKIQYSNELGKLFLKRKKVYQKKLKEFREKQRNSKKSTPTVPLEYHVFFDAVQDPIHDGHFREFFSSSVFVPASRTFFANLQKNIFTFLASNLDIDPYLKEFGSLYENSKHLYNEKFFVDRNKELHHTINEIMKSVVDGEYEYKDEQDWIKSKGKKVNLANASSGQQESLPMLLALSVWPLMNDNKDSMFFIEEPEAHLFPTSQSHIVSLLSILYERGTNFFLTSHSPYILSALNNYIIASDAIKNNKMTLHDFINVNGSGRPIQFEDVAAYTISEGVVKPIMDAEYRMVGGEMLDSVSEHFEQVMNYILDCEG